MTQAGASYPSLNGAKVFITGGATGIGAALVRSFHDQGSLVAFNDLDETAGRALHTELGSRCEFFCTNVTSVAALQGDIDAAAQAFDGLTHLVNNVANDQRHDLETLTEEAYRDLLAVNLDPVVFAGQAAAPLIAKSGGGVILNFSSLNVRLGPADLPIYTAAKAAILGLTKSQARRYGPANIRVNAIVPGWVTTPRQKRLWMTPEAEADWRAACALDAEIHPQDVANLAIFLSATEADKITGQSFVIDAGRT